MPRSKEQFELIRIKSKANIIQAAFTLFSQKGYHSTSTNAIAKEAGVSAGLMYNYYSSKEDLLADIVNQFFEELIAAGSKRMGNSLQEIDAGELIDVIIEQVQINIEHWHLLVSIVFQLDITGQAKEQMDAIFFHQEDMFLMYFKRKGVKHPEESAKVLTTLVHGAMLHAAMAGNMDDLHLLRRTVIEDIIMNGI